jgi:hypothetical protein
MFIIADCDGSYEDSEGNRGNLSTVVLRAIRWMKVDQKVLILEEREGRTEMHIW